MRVCSSTEPFLVSQCPGGQLVDNVVANSVDNTG